MIKYAIIILGTGLLTACMQAPATQTTPGVTTAGTPPAGSSGTGSGVAGTNHEGGSNSGTSPGIESAGAGASVAVQPAQPQPVSTSDGAPSADALEGRWTLIGIGGEAYRPAERARPPFFEIAGNQISGHDGCNMFNGPLQPAGQISATRMACPGGAILPLDLADVGAHLSMAQRSGDLLILPGRAGRPASRYRRD